MSLSSIRQMIGSQLKQKELLNLNGLIINNYMLSQDEKTYILSHH